MPLLYYRYRGTPEGRPGGPWWHHKYSDLFLEDLKPFLEEWRIEPDHDCPGPDCGRRYPGGAPRPEQVAEEDTYLSDEEIRERLGELREAEKKFLGYEQHCHLLQDFGYLCKEVLRLRASRMDQMP